MRIHWEPSGGIDAWWLRVDDVMNPIDVRLVDGGYWVMHYSVFSYEEAETLAGPFETLEAAQAAALLFI